MISERVFKIEEGLCSKLLVTDGSFHKFSSQEKLLPLYNSDSEFPSFGNLDDFKLRM